MQDQINSADPACLDVGQFPPLRATSCFDLNQLVAPIDDLQIRRAHRLAKVDGNGKGRCGSPPTQQKFKQQCSQRDAGLLFCCMKMLRIDRAKLIRDDSLLYRELQGVCTLCPTRQKCSLDLANGGFDAAKWKEMVAVLSEFGNAENDWRAAKLRKNVPIHSRDGV